MPALTLFTWDRYYETAWQRPVSQFARYAEPMFPPAATVIDLGCGTGADATYFAACGHRVTAIDASPKAIEQVRGAVLARVGDAAALPDLPGRYAVGYLRWLLHAVTVGEQERILAWCSRNVDSIFIEARSARGQHPDDHYRRPIDRRALTRELQLLGFAVHTEESHGFSVQGDDDPLLIRAVGVR